LIPVLDGILSITNKLLDFIPDPNKKAALAAELAKQQQDAELQLAQMQADINKIEAGSINWFVAGWRPAAGWLGVLGLTWSSIGLPVARSFLALAHSTVQLPDVNTQVLQTLLFGMLGLGVMRTVEKVQNAEGNR
jgi:hypothetical protein